MPKARYLAASLRRDITRTHGPQEAPSSALEDWARSLSNVQLQYVLAVLERELEKRTSPTAQATR